MNWYLNLRTSAKLSLAFGVIIILLVIISFTGYRTIKMITAAHVQLNREDFAVVRDLNVYESRENAIRLALINMILASSEAAKISWLNDLKNQSEGIETLFPKIKQLLENDPHFSSKLETLEKIRLENKETRNNHVIPLLLAGKTAEAKTFESVQAERFSKMRSITDELIFQAEQRANAAVYQSQEQAKNAMDVLIVISLFSLVIVIYLTWLLNRILAFPLIEISKAAEQIALGNLDTVLKLHERVDEVGVLSGAFSNMTQYLQKMAGLAKRIAEGDLTVKVTPLSHQDLLSNTFLSMVNNLRNITADLNSAVDSLSSTASEMSMSISQLAASSAETATAVSQTSVALEEIRQTAQVANQKSNFVMESAQVTEQVYKAGKNAAEEASNGIQRIHAQMESIAQSMLRLSEQTQAIGGLIAVVDDLAQQSNLLAVNASIEAAKAGEQGKGFAVVAQEIKSLADQSKQATNQVRTILNDIQKATGTAVMATEEGTKAVEAGIEKSVDAGKTITALASNISESSLTASQIAATSHQQLLGMEQSTTAMESIRQSSLQNANSAKQLELSTNTITDLGHKLKKYVGIYRLH